MYITEDKYLPLAIEVEERPTVFVGQNPGKTRKGKYSEYVWDGDTRTSSLLREAVDGYTNVVLTNVCNYQVMSDEHLQEGLIDLQKMIEDLEPKKIVCLGGFARRHVLSLKPECKVVSISHPSYIVRFNRDKEQYINNIRSQLSE